MSHRSLSRFGKVGMTLAFVCLMIGSLAACGEGGGANPSANIDFSGTITIWHNWQGSYLAAKQAIFDAYTKLHPKVKIELVHQDNVVDKTVTAVNAGSGPDIVAWVDDQLGKLAQSRILVPLEQYISPDFIKSTYSPAAAAAVQYNGHVYGVPEAVEAITIMYNKAMVTADQLPKTTDDLLTFEQTYAQANPGKFGLVWNTEDSYTNAPWIYGFGGFFVNDQDKVGLNTPAGIAAAKYIASFKPYLPVQQSYDVDSALFSEGKAAAIINGPWSYADYKAAGIDIGFATLPVVTSTNKAGPPLVGVKSLWVTKLSKNQALDADLLKFYTNQENQVAMAKANGEIPANEAAGSDPSVQALPSVGGYASQAKLGVPLPNRPSMSGVWKPVNDALTAIWSGAQTPEAAMAAAQQAAEQNIANLNA